MFVGMEKCLTFSGFINQMDFIDLPLLDKSFTFFQPNMGCVSHLDRILLCSVIYVRDLTRAGALHPSGGMTIICCPP